jgi:threonine/homoserine/homoserine lactone efflux protein
MIDAGSILTFTIVAFSLGAILIMKKDSLPAHIRRPMAMLAIFMIACAFFLVAFSFMTMTPKG